MILGNIIYDSEIINVDNSKYINYINKNIKYSDLDNNNPTYYVGWKFMKNINNDLNLNILEHEVIKNKLYWGFTYEENKPKHVSDIKYFIENVPYYYFNDKYKYYNIDPIFNNIYSLNDIFKFFNNGIYKTYVYKNESLYFLDFNNTIYGINLNLFNLFNITNEDLINYIKSYTICDFYNDYDGEIFKNYNKLFNSFEILKRYLIVIIDN